MLLKDAAAPKSFLSLLLPIYMVSEQLFNHRIVLISLTWLFDFSRYDIDRDGYVIQEDVRLILSHVPIENSVAGNVAREGIFTQMGGGR